MSHSSSFSRASSPSCQVDYDQLCDALRENVHARLRASVLQVVQVQLLCGKRSSLFFFFLSQRPSIYRRLQHPASYKLPLRSALLSSLLTP